MNTALVTAPASPIAQAQPSLRTLRCSAAWGERGADARQYLTASDRARLPAALEEARAALAPADKSTIGAGLAAALTLVAPAGMAQEERKLWLSSAYAALRDVPADLFRDAINAARRTADHPSKIVPAVIAYADDIIRRRRMDLACVQNLMDADRRMPWEREEPPVEYAKPEDVAAIKAEFGLAGAEARTSRRPATAAEYVAMGLSEAEAAKAVADHERMRGQGAKQVGAAEPVRAAVRLKAPPEIGQGLIAMALVRRYAARRRGDRVALTGLARTLDSFASTYGVPPFRILLPLARAKLAEQRAALAA